MQDRRPACRRASHNSVDFLYSLGRVAESGVEHVRGYADMLAMEEDVALCSTSKGMLWRFSIVHLTCSS